MTNRYATVRQGRFSHLLSTSQSALPCAKPNINPSCLFWAVLDTVLLKVTNTIFNLSMDVRSAAKHVVPGRHDDKDTHATGYTAWTGFHTHKLELRPKRSVMGKKKGHSMIRLGAQRLRPEIGTSKVGRGPRAVVKLQLF